MDKEFLERYAMFVQSATPGGGLLRENAALWLYLLSNQTAAKVKGDLLEIGVLHGYTAALLFAALQPDERCNFIDPGRTEQDFFPQIEKLNGRLPLEQIRFWKLSSFHVRKMGFGPDSSSNGADVDGLRFVHIDGEHSYEAIENDFRVVVDRLVNNGIIVFDDMYNGQFPQLTHALFDLLRKYRSDIVLFLVGMNKAYLCRPQSLGFYRSLIRRAPPNLDILGAAVMICAGGWNTEATYYGISPRRPGTHPYLITNRMTDQVADLP